MLAAAGILLLADRLGRGGLDPVGVVLALAAGGAAGRPTSCSARAPAARFPGGHGLALAMVVGALLALPAGVVQAGDALLDPRLLAVGLVVAIASSVLPYSLELEALRRLRAARVRRADVARARDRRAGRPRRPRPGARGAGELVAIALVLVASAGATLTPRRPDAGAAEPVV